MEFAVSVIFLFLYYIRPQDWMPGFAGANVIKPIIALWVGSLIVQRDRPKAMPGILKTPHDWMILAYLTYVVVTSPEPYGAFMGLFPQVIFYVLTVQSLTSWQRVLSYLKWTNVMLVGLAAIAVASLYGLDLTGAAAVTAANKGRLAIGTWMHDNPNALGHSVVSIIPLSYLLYFWRESASRRAFVFPAMTGLAAYCVYQTESKGAFLIGALGLVTGITVGRPKVFQIFVVTLALTVGMSALAFLPRMNEMGSLKGDQGVQGRMMAWQIAREVTKTQPTGRGINNFQAIITWYGQSFFKATHSSYVQVGADLGEYGLFLYLAVLWCCGRSLVAIRPYTEWDTDRERCRRVTFVLLLAYAGSGWMIDREYVAEYFLLVAAAAAMHRLAKSEEMKLEEPEAPPNAQVPRHPELLGLSPSDRETPALATQRPGSEPAVSLWGSGLWNQFRLSDAGVSVFLTWLVFATWDYIMKM